MKSMMTVRTDLTGKLDTWIETTGDMGVTPESDEVKTYWDEHMLEGYNDRMEDRGLSPDISDEDYVKWWENKLL